MGWFADFWSGEKGFDYSDSAEGQAYKRSADQISGMAQGWKSEYDNWQTPEFLRFGAAERSAMENRFRQSANQEYGRTLWDIKNQMAVSGASLGSQVSVTRATGTQLARQAQDQIMGKMVDVDQYARQLGSQNYQLREAKGQQAFGAIQTGAGMQNQYSQLDQQYNGQREGGWGSTIVGFAADAALNYFTGGAAAASGVSVTGALNSKKKSDTTGNRRGFSDVVTSSGGGGSNVGQLVKPEGSGGWMSSIGEFTGLWNDGTGAQGTLKNTGDWAIVGDNSKGGGSATEIIMKQADGSVRVIPHDEFVAMQRKAKRAGAGSRKEMLSLVARQLNTAAAHAMKYVDTSNAPSFAAV